MKSAIRFDRATLRKPAVTSQGFLRADGYFGRVGIYEYPNDDGSTRYELRPLEEVGSPDALASFDAAPVTLGHPAEEVTAENVRRHEVGTVSGEARMDGEYVAGGVVIKDARAIKQVRGGKQELSPGYRIKLDETPGADRRYGYPGNTEGRYDAIQREIRVNHLAIVDRARGGLAVRLRMDALEQRADGGKLTTADGGHQHLIELTDCDGVPRSSGCTGWAMAEGADGGHEHGWIRNADGTITIAASAGHTHGILDENRPIAPPGGTRADREIDRSGMRPESGRMAQPTMDADEQIRSLKAQLDESEAKLAPLAEAAKKSAARADGAEARTVTLSQENEELRAKIAAAATVVETEAIRREKTRADAAEDRLRRLDEERGDAIDARVELVREVVEVMGPEFKTRGIPDRELLATVVKRLDASADIGPSVSIDFLRGRHASLLERFRRTARSNHSVATVITENQRRADSLDEKRAAYRAQGLDPLPNDPRARKGA